MKKNFKGFTLVECLVAMAILAVACMALGAIEATVSQRNNFNHFNNSSLANQMAYVEKYNSLASVAVYYGGGTKPTKDSHVSSDKKPPHQHDTNNNGTTAWVQIQKLDKDENLVTDDKYSFPVDIYVMYSRDTQDQSTNTVTKNASGDRTVTENTGYGNLAGYFSTDGTTTNSDGENQGNLRYKYVLGHTGK